MFHKVLVISFLFLNISVPISQAESNNNYCIIGNDKYNNTIGIGDDCKNYSGSTHMKTINQVKVFLLNNNTIVNGFNIRGFIAPHYETITSTIDNQDTGNNIIIGNNYFSNTVISSKPLMENDYLIGFPVSNYYVRADKIFEKLDDENTIGALFKLI